MTLMDAIWVQVVTYTSVTTAICGFIFMRCWAVWFPKSQATRAIAGVVAIVAIVAAVVTIWHIYNAAQASTEVLRSVDY